MRPQLAAFEKYFTGARLKYGREAGSQNTQGEYYEYRQRRKTEMFSLEPPARRRASTAVGAARVRSQSRSARPLVRSIPDPRRYSAPLFVKRRCGRTLGAVRRESSDSALLLGPARKLCEPPRRPGTAVIPDHALLDDDTRKNVEVASTLIRRRKDV